MERRVGITGIGVISSLGTGRDEFLKNCLDGTSHVEHVPEHWHRYTTLESTLWTPLPPVDFSRYKISRIEAMQMDMSAKLSNASSYLALIDAGYEPVLVNEKKNKYSIEGINPERWGVFWGTGAGGVCSLIGNEANHIVTPVKKRLAPAKTTLESQGVMLDDILVSQPRFNVFCVSMFMPNSCSSSIAIKYSLHGVNETNCSACASGTAAIGRAFSEIRNGSIDCAVTGGVDYLKDDYGAIFRGFDNAKTLVRDITNPQTANRPFDKKRSGFLFSEGGCGTLVLEEFSHARKRNASIVAEVTAFDQTCDAYNIMMLEPSGRQIRRMIGNCLDQSGSSPEDIDYINAHGTGTELNDAIEAEILLDVFGERPYVNSTKSLIGHTIGASGAIEAIVSALSVNHDITHICKNLEDPVNSLNFVRQTKHTPMKKALTHSFAFGGHNAGLIIEKFID